MRGKLAVACRVVVAWIFVALVIQGQPASSQAVSGYSEYVLPGDELNMYYIFNELDNNTGATAMHSVTSVVAWSAATTVYYDHWENGYGFNPSNPVATADEIVTLASPGSVRVFESTNVPSGGPPPNPRSASATCPGQGNPGNRCYDGGDRIYVAGGVVTVTRAVWIDSRGVGNQGDAWEIYPVKPQLTTYILPFGEDLFATSATYFYGFERVYALIQATEDNTTFTVDLNNDGTPDVLNQNRDANWNTTGPGTVAATNGSTVITGTSTAFTNAFPGNPIAINGVVYKIQNIANNTSLTLATAYTGTTGSLLTYVLGDSSTVFLERGQTFLLDRVSACRLHANCTTNPGSLNTGVAIYGNKTLQVKYVAGNPGDQYLARGLSAFPRGYWTNTYYAPFGQPTGTGANRFTDYYLYNPGSSALTVNWESLTGSGSFSIPANGTQSFNRALGANPSVPVGSGIYFSAATPFWGVGFGDSTFDLYEWGYSLLPTNLLYKEHYFGWSPGSLPLLTAPVNGNGVFLTAAQDNTTVFVDYDNNGTADQTYTLSRLQSQFVPPGPAGDLSGARVWATGLFTMAYGQNPEFATTPTPNLDLGYVALPGDDYVSLVLTVDKTANPEIVSTASGSTTTFTIDVDSQEYNVDEVTVQDVLPPNWEFVPGSATITLPNLTQITGASANPQRVITYKDRFNTIAYNNNDSTPSGTNWTTVWRESGEGTDPAAGRIRVMSDTGVSPSATALRMWGSGGRYAARMANLTGTAATLRFKYRREFADAADNVSIDVCSNATDTGTTITCGTWSNVTTISGVGNNFTDAAYAEASFALGPAFNATNFAVRFQSNVSDNTGAESIWIDDVEIETVGTGLSGPILRWPSSQLGGMAQNQRIRITFTGRTTAVLPSGTLSRNDVTATGTRTVAVGATQTFNTSDFAYVASGQISLTKTSSVPYSTPLYPGDTFNYTVTVDNPAGAPTVTGVSLYDTLPAGVSYVGPVSSNRSTVGDRFRQVLYTLNDGTNSWLANWSEVNDGGTDPTTGDIRVVNGELRLDNSASNEPSVRRTVNLSGATSAVLSFRYRTDTGVDAADTILLQAAAAGVGGPWTTVGTFTGIVGAASATATADISAHVAAGTAIRFVFTNGNYEGTNENFFVDDLFITYNVADANAANSSVPDLIYGPTLLAGQSLTLTIPVRVDNPLATGIDTLTNVVSVTAREFPIALTASATNIVTNPSALSSSAAGRIWFDTDGDGIDDVGEPGIANVDVTLKDEFGTPIATVTTDSNGRYLFPNVLPKPCTGSCPRDPATTAPYYYVEVSGGLPGGLSQTCCSGRILDNQTRRFYLAAGENRTGLDMGYTTPAGTVAFGDTVWVDTNGNGAENPGEVGLAGVTVQLYRDANADGVLQPGSDTLVATAMTAPDGSYLFAGITPTGATYFVAAATPAGYIATTPLNQRFTSVTGNTSYLTADFGFQPTGTTYSISDRVWLDGNGDQAYGGGEIGIGGVTVDLLDASLNVIGTTTTAADGTFTFAGLAGGGADYTVRITDVNGVLADFAGTTPYAQNRQRGEPNLTANIDRRNASPCAPAIAPCPSYGFRPTRAIGDTLFFDADGDGVQDSGEGGIPSVVVSLYSDANGDGVINGADAVIRTVTTDAAGQYLFSGLNNGNYIVSVPLQSGYTYSPDVFADSDPSAAGIQRAVPMTGTNVFTADFGFEPNTPTSVSGTVWDDANRSGAGSPEPGESGLAGVVVSLYSDADGDGIIETGDVVVATTTTDSSGNYSFTGVASGTYVVRITDGAGILTSYESTYEVTGGRSGPFNFQEAVNLTGGNASGINFGYAVPTPTYASVVAFEATLSAGSVVVEWQTASEVGTIGFHVERLDPKSNVWIRVHDSLLPAILTGPQGGSYRLRDATAPTRETLTYRLVETEASGLTLTYGPFRVTPEKTSTFTGTFERTARPISPENASRLTASAAEKAVFDIGGEAQTGVKAKILTAQTGLHRVEAADIAQRLGVPLATVTSAIASGGLLLENQGNVVSYLPEAGNTALYFYAEAIESPFTAQNATLASLAPGSLMQAGDTPLTLGRTPATSFADKVVLEEDRYPLILISSDPAGDLWAWDYLYASDPSLASRVLNVPVPSPASDMTPILTVRLRGSSDTPPAVDHDVSFSWNGSTLGSVGWGGFEPFTATFELPAQSLKAGDNALSLSSRLVPGAPYDLVYIDSIELSYRRAYRAVGNELSFTVAPGADVTVQGFTTNAIVLLDITDPRRPVPVWGARLAPASDGTFGLRFGNRGASERRFLATTLAKAGKPFQVAAVKASSLRSETNAADLIVIAPDFLAQAASELVSYRQRQGRSTLLVSLESIYDEFSHSLSTPYAIRDFLKFASENWRRAPRYVTLVGRGTFDYKGISGTNDNILPTLLTPTPMGLNASDFSFLDWGTPASRNMSIGRLPVLTSQELKDYLRKITANESASGAPALAVLLTADNPDASGDFLAGSESVGAYVPLSSPASRVYLSYVDASSGREAIKSALSRGAGIFNYVGHGGLDTLAHENLFSSADVAALTKVPRLSSFVAITCSAGNFAIPGYPSLAETLVLAKDSGSQAAWTASGLSNNDAGVRLNQRFFERRFVLGERVLGDLVRQSLQDIEVKSEVGYVKKIYNILGEPVSQLP
ncbi:MAG: hypothetical protein DIJKHBIC_04054 [Thermoanaerobaculia bacterium]|nr:hypothetical protein [Thermoanaerobaculia bacterium]